MEQVVSTIFIGVKYSVECCWEQVFSLKSLDHKGLLIRCILKKNILLTKELLDVHQSFVTSFSCRYSVLE